MKAISVNNEIGKLKKVLLHRPGEELLNMTPDTLKDLLFDDIPYLRRAQEEHDYFAKIFEDNGIEVVYLEDLMAETLDNNGGIKEEFIEQFLTEAGVRNRKYREAIYEYLMSFKDNKELVLKTMAGININEIGLDRSHSLIDMIIEGGKMLINAMPNLLFTRDPFASVGNGIVLNKMYTITRSRETIYADYIFNYHPEYSKDIDRLYDRTEPFSIEGGDVLNLNENTLAVGISQRTEADAIEVLAKNIFYESDSHINTILAFDIPERRAFMHLDTVFTQIDYDKFTVHPGILGTLRVFELTRSKTSDPEELNIIEIEDTLENILSKYLDTKVELILCGGGDRIAAEREQWNDGSNTLCISPGKIIVYERNDVTNKLLRDKGLDVIEMPSGELSRGRGGPRCMSMPLIREDL
ncbi:MAG: arginine deiminase [Tissierellia bacterium]|nr:arginine deiminase [Tissierellia bacterium]